MTHSRSALPSIQLGPKPGFRGAAAHRACWLSVCAVLLACAPARAQEPTPQSAPSKPLESPASKPLAVVAIKVGVIHPVSGPPIEDGVILIEGTRIRAVGKAQDVQIPEGARVLDYAKAHAYPGLVDARTTAFADRAVLEDGSVDAGTRVLTGLDGYEEESTRLVQAGVTTAHVTTQSPAMWGGISALIRPEPAGFEPFEGAADAAVRLRLTAGSGASHALVRQKEFAKASEAFGGLEAYQKRFTDHDKAMLEYEKKYAEYFDHFRNRASQPSRGGEGGAPAGEPRQGRQGGQQRGEGEAQTPPEGRRRIGRRNPSGEDGAQPASGPQSRPQGGGAETAHAAASQGTATQSAATPGEGRHQGGGEPKKPTYPKAPAREPDKEALLRVQKGELALWVEAHRDDEIEAALALAREQKIPRMVLECRRLPAKLAEQIAKAGIAVVVTGIEPGAAPAPGEETRDAGLLERVQAAGIPCAIASGSAKAARFLPLLAAWACGEGLSEDAALAAVTLAPARILGVGKQVGSLEPGKLADIVLASAPLLQSDARVLAVIAAGKTEFEAEPKATEQPK